MSAGQHIGYIRVSSILQNTERQLIGIELDESFTDRCSGKDVNRPQLDACLKYIRKGDTLHVHSIDRLARSLVDLQSLVGQITDKGVTLRFHKENLTFAGDATDPFAVFQLQLLGAVAELERNLLRERQREGIAIAKSKGKYKGRNPLKPHLVEEIQSRRSRGDSIALISREMNVARTTVYKYLEDAETDSA